MQEPTESRECNPGTSWKFPKQSWNPLEFGSAKQELLSSKQYNSGKVQNFSRDFQATVRSKPGANPPPPPVTTFCLGLQCC